MQQWYDKGTGDTYYAARARDYIALSLSLQENKNFVDQALCTNIDLVFFLLVISRPQLHLSPQNKELGQQQLNITQTTLSQYNT